MKNLKRNLLALTTATILAAGGCKMFQQLSQSRFLSAFSIDESVRSTGYAGINHSGPGGSIGGSSGGVGERGADVRLSSATGFMINEAGGFDEREFMETLRTQIKKEIEDSGGSVTASGSQEPNEFYFDYRSSSIEGRITISGSRRGSYYSLKANVEENSRK